MSGGGSILLSGVGGQGILLASEITAYALMEAGFDVKKSEVHGMAQRGGSVVAHLRYGAKVHSPLIEPGGADIVGAFELLEALRYLPFMKPSTKVIVNTQRILPPSVALGQQEYPDDPARQLRAKGLDVYEVDALGVAREVGELRTVNMVLVGAYSTFLPMGAEVFLKVIRERVKKGFAEVNQEAFNRGRALSGGR